MRTAMYRVQLTPEDRQELEALLRKGKHSVQHLKRAQVLLLADQGKPNRLICEVTGLTEATIIAHKKRYLEEGLRLKDKPRKPRGRILDSRQESYLVALTCSDPPEGRERWTMQLLADRLIAVEVVEAVSDETVRRTLKKTRSSPGSSAPGVSAAKSPRTTSGA